MNIAILGFGTVGSGVYDLLKNASLDINVISILVKDESQITNNLMVTNFDDVLNNETIDTIVECIGGVDIPFKYCLEAIKHGKNVVTSNKAMMAYHYEELVKEANFKNVSVLFEASVGGGIPWIYNLFLAKKISPILSFSGIMNGTTNYILDKMFKEDCSFDEALLQAQDKGYAEKDPTSDIDGYDTRNKICLSANVAWDICTTPDNVLFAGIRNITNQEIFYCKSNNLTCRLIGEGDFDDGKYSLLCIPEFVDKDSAFGVTTLNNNTIELINETLGCLSFTGQGAGKYPTAHAILQDLLLIKYNRPYRVNITHKIRKDDTLINQRFYIRTKNTEFFEDIIEQRLDDNTIITKIVNAKDIFNLLWDTNDESLFIAGLIK